MHAQSTVRTTQSEVNIVIGVVLGEVVVVRVHIPLVCDDAVIGLALGLIAHVIVLLFVEAKLQRICCWEIYC